MKVQIRSQSHRRRLGGAWWLQGGVNPANAVGVYQPIGAASLAASYVNLANPGTYNAAPGVAPTWDAVNGWTFNGSTQYLTTGITPLLSWSIFCRFSDVPSHSINTYLFGGYYSTTRRYGIPPNVGEGASNSVYYENGGKLTTAPALLTGILGFAGNNAYRNGVAAGTIPNSGESNVAIYVGSRNRVDISTVDSMLNGKIKAIAIYNATLTAEQVAAISAAMAAL